MRGPLELGTSQAGQAEHRSWRRRAWKLSRAAVPVLMPAGAAGLCMVGRKLDSRGTSHLGRNRACPLGPHAASRCYAPQVPGQLPRAFVLAQSFLLCPQSQVFMPRVVGTVGICSQADAEGRAPGAGRRSRPACARPILAAGLQAPLPLYIISSLLPQTLA